MAYPHEACIKGSIHNGLPQGTEEMVHGLNTYVIGNRKNPRGIIVIYSDIFGLELPNNKLIADGYARSGEWLVYLPDFFKGDSVSLKFADVAIPVDASKQTVFCKYTGLLASAPGLVMWMSRHKTGPTNKICMDFLESLRRATPRNEKIGMAGFCWGGRYALRAGLEYQKIEIDGERIPLIDAIVALHPSNLDFPEDVDSLIVPTSIGWGLRDENTKIELKGHVEQIHKAATNAGIRIAEVEHQIHSPGRHGFAVRGNPDDPQERQNLVDSEKQALDWFSRWL